jgi:hypothetical protein
LRGRERARDKQARTEPRHFGERAELQSIPRRRSPMARKKLDTEHLSREEWVSYWLNHKWRRSMLETNYVNINKYNVLYMQDHNDPEVWTFRIAPEGSRDPSDDEWSKTKYRTAEEAKKAALERLAEILEI